MVFNWNNFRKKGTNYNNSKNKYFIDNLLQKLVGYLFGIGIGDFNILDITTEVPYDWGLTDKSKYIEPSTNQITLALLYRFLVHHQIVLFYTNIFVIKIIERLQK